MSRTTLLLLSFIAVGGCTGSAETDGTSDTDDTTVTPETLANLDDPCVGLGPVYAMHTHDNALFVGCGNGAGLWMSTDNGESFSAAHPSTDFYVFDLATTADGDLLACGHDYDPDYEDVLVRRWDGTDWEELLFYGNNDEASNNVFMSNCGQAAEHPNGGLFVISNTSADMSVSTDGGKTWTKEDRYFEEVNLDGGPQAYQLQQVVTTTGGLYASGYNVAEPPTFFMPSTATGAEWYNVKAVEIDATVDGEGWALATPDDGASWYVGGRDQGAGAAATGFLYESTDGGATWTSLTLGDEIDIIRDIDFADDGMHGIAVGDRYPPNSLGGFALITEDGGSTWTELDEDLPEDLQRCEAEGSDWFIGGNGTLFRGSF